MPILDRFMRMTGASLPLVQSGMGGVAQPRLAAAVAETGAVGMIGLYRHTPDEIMTLLAHAADLTQCRIGVNFVPFVLSEDELRDRLDVVLADPKQPLVTFFGMPSKQLLGQAAARGPCGVQVGDIVEAERAFAGGAAFVILQTADAGGHHLGALTWDEALAALPKSSLATRVVLVSGGVSNAGRVRAALAAGFAGVLCGTVFAAAAESHAHPLYKRMIVASQPQDTVITDAFSIGWHTHQHRVIRNRSCDREAVASIIGNSSYFGKRYPILRYSVAVPTEETEGEIGEMALYCGTSCASIVGVEPVRDIMRRLIDGV